MESHPAVTSVHYAPPSELAALLRAGELDVALVPQVEARRDPSYRIVPELCVSCHGAIESILLFSRESESPPTESGEGWDSLRRIAVDASSNSSVELLRVLLSQFGVAAELEAVPPSMAALEDPESPFDAVLLSGDAALEAAQASKLPRLDLGSVWFARTGLPFVFAVWLGRDGLDPATVEGLIEVGTSALARREELARSFVAEHPEVGDAELAVRYVTDVVHYSLGTDELLALRAFDRMRTEAGLVPSEKWMPRLFSRSAGATR